ncbi:hypothetical protein VNI00_010355 [Paramarasmius palmivorus]|uniref:Uncharacterized protein n=1 Tax=Paramarasmius palmivorus TaxID=297713 RepID=A0AAW0CKW0_9AGAR
MESNAKVLHLFDFSFVEIHDPSEELTLILTSSLLKDTGEAILYREIRPRDTCTKRFQLLGIATNVTKYFEGASAPLIPGANAEWEIELGMWDNHVMERYNAKVDMEFFRQAFVLKEVEEEFGVKMCGVRGLLLPQETY